MDPILIYCTVCLTVCLPDCLPDCLSVCLQGHSTLQASQDFSTLLTWTAGMNSQKTVNAAATTRRKSKSRTASQVRDGGTQQEVDSVGHPGTEGCQSKPCSVFCCVSVCIDRAVFASIEDSDSDLDNHGEDSSSNTSADDHMTTKRSECCLQGAGVKEVRGQNPASGETWAEAQFSGFGRVASR